MSKEVTIRSVDRALTIIESFTHKDSELTLKQISIKTGIALTTVHRIMQTLLAKGFIELDQESGKYRLGVKFVRLGGIVIKRTDIVNNSYPWLKKLAQETELNVNLSVYDNQEALCLINIESFHHFGFEIKVGQRMPIYAGALSKAILAYLPEEELNSLSNEFEAVTPLTISQKTQLQEEIQQIRTHGYAQSHGELALGAIAYAAPIFNHEGQIAAGIAISGPINFLPEHKRQQYIDALLRASSQISQEMGYAPVI
ncbi:IclR family transcriptional regulator [Thalassobacillus hwangdonensis]|uniref:IclR family transcriptional regulator n=1 Tax=Thalassobacillus hwangdonensis TaxID=546108 RepID=A0ABW3L1A8_9BACI